MTHSDGRERQLAVAVGVGLVFGVVVGTILFVVMSNPVWLGLGPGLGITFGAAFGVVGLEGQVAATDRSDRNPS